MQTRLLSSFFLLSLFGAEVAAQPLLEAPSIYRMFIQEACGSDEPKTFIDLGDLNQDGHLDLLTTRTDRFGGGDGTFPAGTGFSRSPANAIALGDFNEDGLLDRVEVFTEDNRVTLYKGNGAGGFNSQNLYFPGVRPIAVMAVDVDQDDHLDIAVGRRQPGETPDRLTVLFNDGTGNIEFVRQYSVGPEPRALATDDFDRDGRPDVAVLSRNSQEVTVFWGNESRSAADSSVVDVSGAGGSLYDIAAGDLDGDLNPDLVVSSGSSRVTVFPGTGSRIFGISGTPQPTTSRAHNVVLGDLDRDSHLDIVTAVTGGVNIFYGTGSVSTFDRVLVRGGAVVANDVSLGDIDEDGALDIVYSSYPGPLPGLLLSRDDYISTLVAKGGRSFAVSRSAPARNPRTVEVGDLDLDGHLDVVVGHDFGNEVSVYLGDGSGELPAPQGIPVGANPQVARITDLNGDTLPDLVTANTGDETISVLLGDLTGGTWSLIPAATIDLVDPPITLPAVNLITSDINGDLNPDLVVLTGTPGLLDGNNDLLIYLGDGTGNFSRTSVTPNNASGSQRSTLASGDFNEDGHVDLVVSEQQLAVYLGNGTGTFTRTVASASIYVFGQSVLDINDDDHLDILLTDLNQGLLAFLGDGSGSFVASPHGGQVGNLAVNDLDEDGNLDALVLSTCVEVRAGNGSGGFAGASIFAASIIQDGACGDFDEDGHADLVFTNDSSEFSNIEYVGIFRNASLDSIDCRKGNVNAGLGPVADVLFVNGSSGNGPERRITLATGEPFTISMGQPPTAGGATPYVLYLTIGLPEVRGVKHLPFGIGSTCLRTPLNLGRPFRTANPWGHSAVLGEEKWPVPTSHAPTDVLVAPNGAGRTAQAFLQGLIADPGSTHGQVAVTNAIEFVVE